MSPLHENLSYETPKNCAIKRCTCKSEYQDVRYGKNQRVHNRTQVGRSALSKWRCTVCEKERE